MATYVLIHGAADSGWFWHLLEAELRRRGHDVVAPDLPCGLCLHRFFPAPFMRRVARDRLGVATDEIDGSHCVALSRPAELADRLEAFRTQR